jgi:hypothetical protein
MQQFADQYLCEFKPTPADEFLFEVAKQYVRDTEAYDRTVCSGPIINGSIMPATSHQAGLSSRNASKLFATLLNQNAGSFTAKELRQEIWRIEARGL